MKTSYERERQESRLSRRFFPETYSYPEIGTEDPEGAALRSFFAGDGGAGGGEIEILLPLDPGAKWGPCSAGGSRDKSELLSALGR